MGEPTYTLTMHGLNKEEAKRIAQWSHGDTFRWSTEEDGVIRAYPNSEANRVEIRECLSHAESPAPGVESPRKEARKWLDSCPTCKVSFPEGGYHNCPAVREIRDGGTSGAERSAILGFVRWSYPTRSAEEAERLVDSYLALKGNNHE